MKTFLKFFLGFIVLLSISIFLVLKFVSLNSFKGEISKYAKQNYKMDIVFKEDITHSLFKPGTIVFNDIRIAIDKKDILKFGKLLIDFKLNSLIQGDMTIESIILKQASLDINQKDIDKIQSRFTSSKKKESTKKIKEKFEFKIRKFNIENSDVLYEDFRLKSFNMKSKITNEIVDIHEIQFNLYGGDVDSKALIKYSQPSIEIKSSGSFNKIDLSTWDPNLKNKNLSTTGHISIDYDVKWNQNQPKSPAGSMTVQSKDIKITGMNLNKLLQGFIDSREVGLLDIASYATLGPIGAIVTNTLETGKSYPGLGRGESHIKQFYVETELGDGLVKMKDAALTTEKYRLAAFGNLDIIDFKYQDFAIHILNKKGCTRIFQRLTGPLSSPDVGAAKTFAKGVISPLTNLFDKVRNLTGCKPVYEGKVDHP